MEKKYSNLEFMKVVRRNSSTLHAEKLLNDIYMDLFLNRVHREQTRVRLQQRIDKALDVRDEEAFKQYAKQLAALNKEK